MTAASASATASAAAPILRLALLALLVLVAPLAAWIAADQVTDAALSDLRTEAQTDLALYRGNLLGELDRQRAVPLVLADDAEIRALLQAPQDPALAARVNRRLEAIAGRLQLSALYLMDARGTTVAADNWNHDPSFVGQNFGYRPYFQAALAGRPGLHFALGVTSHVPGYYIAYPVRPAPPLGVAAESLPVIGVVVVKIGLDDLERHWRPGENAVVVADGDGVIVLANRPSWRFHTLAPLAPAEHERIIASQRYPGEPLEPLPLVAAAGGASDELVVREEMPREAESAIHAVRYLVSRAPVPGTDLQLVLLLRTEPARLRTTNAGLIAGFSALLLGFGILYLVERRGIERQRRASQQRARQELEAQVALRTADLTAANLRLRREMTERERAEEGRRAAQNELVQAAKLAALGELSAGIAHEINQPLAAMRSFADNGVTLLERGQSAAARANLEQIADLTERLAGITRQLKSFARQASGTLEPVAVVPALNAALALVAVRLRQEGVTVERHLPPGEAPWAVGEAVRLQQVLINLICNALDAMRDRPRRQLTLIVRCDRDEDGGQVQLAVADSGCGIAEADLPQLFQRFFTTKGREQGLGLGLSISYGIVRDFGGTLEAANRPEGGAVFTLTLKRAPGPAPEAAATRTLRP